MYRPGFRAEGLRLARDLKVKVVGPLDGLPPSALTGGQLADRHRRVASAAPQQIGLPELTSFSARSYSLFAGSCGFELREAVELGQRGARAVADDEVELAELVPGLGVLGLELGRLAGAGRAPRRGSPRELLARAPGRTAARPRAG